MDDFSNSFKEVCKLKKEYMDILAKTGNKKCIACKRIGGTVFDEFIDEQSIIKIIDVHCGVTPNPCQLHIRLESAIVNNIKSSKIDFENKITKLKNDIIRLKNDVMFGFVSENAALELFETLKSDLNETEQLYRSIMDHWSDIVANTKTYTELNQLNYNVAKNIHQLKELVSKRAYAESVEVYTAELKPAVVDIQKKKYHVNEVIRQKNKKLSINPDRNIRR
jgi:hypothetical protein